MNHQQMTMGRIGLGSPLSARPLSKMPYAQASVAQYPRKVALISYATKVAEIKYDANGAWLRVYGLYSATTRRHISAFMREYGIGNDYYTARMCSETGYWYNLETGEITKELEE